MKYSGTCKQAGIQFPVSFDVNDGRIDNFVPPEFEEALFGAAIIAHVNYQNLQVHGILYKLPTPIEVWPNESKKPS